MSGTAVQTPAAARRGAVRRAARGLVLATLLLAPSGVLGVVLATTVRPAAASAAAVVRGKVTAVGAVGITVSDMHRSLAFYSGVLGFQKRSEVEVEGDAIERLWGVFGARARVARLQLGDEWLELTEYLAPRGKPRPAEQRSNDRWFQHVAIVVSDMDSSYAWLRRHRVEHASTGPQRLPDWNPNAGGIRAFYFRDPDGHPLEVIWFPSGKGDPKWRPLATPAAAAAHDGPAGLFLGIDHTAIVVADTEASLAFYRDVLGLRVAGTSENYGIEQERLNNVFGARLRITGLRAPAGPGIEFLEYLAPRDGRSLPADERANDLVHWHTQLVGSNVETLAQAARASGSAWISPGAVELTDHALGFVRAALVRDPDGHVMELIEP